MKKRIVSALIASAILLPIILIGGKIFYLGLSLVSFIALFEIMKAKESEKELPLEIKIIALLSFILILISDWTIDIRITLEQKIMIMVLSLLIPTIVYRKKEKYSIVDACFLIGSILLLGIGFNNLGVIRIETPVYFAYLLMITIVCDTFAYISGSLIGKHKLAQNISPNKTVEGFICAVVMGTVVSSLLMNTLVSISLVKILVISFVLSVLSQVGDLIFSAIKRYFKIKDYGDIMPGHGGVLDRLDSLIIISIVFKVIINFI